MCISEKQLKDYKKIRQEWEINPKTRIKQSKKNYNRAKAKLDFLKTLDFD
jgi:hypothetical protein